MEQRGEKAECAALSAVGGCGRDYVAGYGGGLVARGKHQKQCLVAL